MKVIAINELGDKLNTHNRWAGEFDKNGNLVNSVPLKIGETIDVVNKKRNVSDKCLEIIKSKRDLKEYSKLLGGYINMCYVRNELLFNKINIDRANISRLIFLSTYIDYNDRKENLLVKHGKYNELEPMTKKDMKTILGLGDTAFKSFIKDVESNHLLYIVGDRFYISSEYFNRGKNNLSNFSSKEYTRIFINTTRQLYKSSTSRQHKQLSYAYQLIPLAHYETNIICENPSEMEFKNINKLSLKDICLFLGVSTERKSMNKLENDLYKLFVGQNKEKTYLFKRVIVKGGEGKRDYFIINPKVIWGGKNLDVAMDTIDKLIF